MEPFIVTKNKKGKETADNSQAWPATVGWAS